MVFEQTGLIVIAKNKTFGTMYAIKVNSFDKNEFALLRIDNTEIKDVTIFDTIVLLLIIILLHKIEMVTRIKIIRCNT